MAAKKKQTWMGLYNPSAADEVARNWCISNNIRISPGGTQKPSEYTVDVSVPNKIWVKSPKTYTDIEAQEVMYNYYNYYYNKRK